MSWGDNGTQEHYEAGRAVETVRKSQIAAVCKCGYLQLKPTNAFERTNGGLNIKRSTVEIVDDAGDPVKRLTGVHRYHHCNACVNDWR